MAPPPNKPMTGLSLYSGITFSSQATTDSVASTSASADATASSSSKAAGDHDAEKDKPSAPQPSTSSSSWSAALRFAPRKSTGRGGGAGGAKSRPRPPAAALVASAFSSAPVDDASSEDTGSDAAQTVDSPTTPAPSVHDVHAGTSRSKSNQAAAITPAATLPAASSSATLLGPLATATFELPVIAAPPALSLPQEEIDADRKLARQAAIARGDRRGGGGGGPGAWGQESGGWRHGGDDEYGHDEDEEEDVNGFLASSAGAKARKKKNKRKRHAPVAPAQQALDYDADYDPRVPNEYATWRDVLRTRRRAIKERQQHREEYEDDEEPSWSRAKMGRWDDRAQRDDEEEEEKLYLSPPPQPQAALLPPGPPPLPPPPSGPPPSKAISGEEAYQRRLAMSSGAAAQPAPPQQVQAKPPPMNPAEALAARQSAAAAIAARLAKAAPPSAPSIAAAAAAAGQDASTSSPSIDQNPADFAQRVMAQWGHTEGQGLGADDANRGRAEALVMEKVGPNKKRGWGPGSSSAPAPPARGKYTTQDPRAQQDLERFGPPSRVVVLEGIIESHEEVDSPSAAAEIEEEVRSAATAAGPGSGTVERVQLAPPTRVFVVFTGMAGAWKCVRELDGRFFAGRRVRAAYYDEGALLVGDYWRH